MYKKFVKRFFDIFLSLIALILLLLPMLVVAVIVKLDTKGPALFKQKRVGIHKKHFNIYKFRSMPVRLPNDVPTHLMQNTESMLTPFERFIRKHSIDELPQLLNILRGDMSVIGPRPALWNQYDLIEERDKYGANDVRPGLTGWAQINGRDEINITEKAFLDGEYVKSLSFLFDLKCFFKTIGSVLRSDGVVEGGATADTADVEQRQAVVKK